MKELLSFKGRTSRRTYWRTYLQLTIMFAVVWAAGLFAVINLGPWGALIFLPTIPLFVAGIAVVIRRLHDRNKGWPWVLGLYIAPQVLMFGPGALIERGVADGPALAAGLVMLLGFGLSIWSFIEIGLRRGTAGPNRFGPAPTF